VAIVDTKKIKKYKVHITPIHAVFEVQECIAEPVAHQYFQMLFQNPLKIGRMYNGSRVIFSFQNVFPMLTKENFYISSLFLPPDSKEKRTEVMDT
jgi:hypothetical protein